MEISDRPLHAPRLNRHELLPPLIGEILAEDLAETQIPA